MVKIILAVLIVVITVGTILSALGLLFYLVQCIARRKKGVKIGNPNEFQATFITLGIILAGTGILGILLMYMYIFIYSML